MSKDTGGLAFPSRGGMMFYVPKENADDVKQVIDSLDAEHAGMTLRDYFAAKERSEPDSFFAEEFATKATQYNGSGGRRPLTSLEMMQRRCAWRYAMADAMLAERAK